LPALLINYLLLRMPEEDELEEEDPSEDEELGPDGLPLHPDLLDDDDEDEDEEPEVPEGFTEEADPFAAPEEEEDF
jgi:hypothetical protein